MLSPENGERCSRQFIYLLNGNNWTWIGNVVWFVDGRGWGMWCGSWMGVYGEFPLMGSFVDVV